MSHHLLLQVTLGWIWISTRPCTQDPYANYVVQRALTVTSGELHMQLVDAIRPFLPTLRGTPHGKRILAKINLKL